MTARRTRRLYAAIATAGVLLATAACSSGGTTTSTSSAAASERNTIGVCGGSHRGELPHTPDGAPGDHTGVQTHPGRPEGHLHPGRVPRGANRPHRAQGRSGHARMVGSSITYDPTNPATITSSIQSAIAESRPRSSWTGCSPHSSRRRSSQRPRPTSPSFPPRRTTARRQGFTQFSYRRWRTSTWARSWPRRWLPMPPRPGRRRTSCNSPFPRPPAFSIPRTPEWEERAGRAVPRLHTRPAGPESRRCIQRQVHAAGRLVPATPPADQLHRQRFRSARRRAARRPCAGRNQQREDLRNVGDERTDQRTEGGQPGAWTVQPYQVIGWMIADQIARVTVGDPTDVWDNEHLAYVVTSANAKGVNPSDPEFPAGYRGPVQEAVGQVTGARLDHGRAPAVLDRP